MLSESTARLVEHAVMLAEPEWVRIKGADEPVRAHRLMAISPRDGQVKRAEASFVGRRWEMAALDAIVDRTINGRGGVVNVQGPPGIGKNRAARETAALAAGRGVEVYWAFCESHAGDTPFHVVAQLLRAGPGIADPDVPLPAIDPGARRRRLTALVNATTLARTEPALFIIEDAHWINAVSESMLSGERGDYVCCVDVAEVSVPATVQAAIEARIDRLNAPAKRTLNAASVIGARFDADLLTALGIEPAFDVLVKAELIDQVRFTPSAEYAFRHPLIRAVAYESQLRSDRAQWHRRLAAAIQESEPGSVEDNAALIAEHLQAGGELHAAYGWHMRAAAWSTDRDIDAARLSWERARKIADALPADDPDQLSMRIAPRTMLCATDWQARAILESRGRFAELRELCSAAGDKVSLAIGMSGLATELAYAGRSREGSRLASEQMALLESIGDPTLTMGLAFIAFANWLDAGEFGEVLRWSQTVIDLAAGDPAKGAGFGFGSPLAGALTYRNTARWWLGRPGWHQDLHDAVAMARHSDPATFAVVVTWTYGHAMPYGVLRADDAAVRASEEAVHTAGASHDVALGLAEYTLAVALLYQDSAADCRRRLDLMVRFREFVRERGPFLVPVAELWIVRDRAERGDRDAAIAVMHQAVDELCQAGRLFLCVWGTGVLVESLLDRGNQGDMSEAQEAIDWLANLAADDGSAVRDITLLRLRSLLAKGHADEAAYRDYRDRYRAIAESLGFEGHIAWAEAM
jgi:hypothetical protein